MYSPVGSVHLILSQVRYQGTNDSQDEYIVSSLSTALDRSDWFHQDHGTVEGWLFLCLRTQPLSVLSPTPSSCSSKAPRRNTSSTRPHLIVSFMELHRGARKRAPLSSAITRFHILDVHQAGPMIYSNPGSRSFLFSYDGNS